MTHKTSLLILAAIIAAFFAASCQTAHTVERPVPVVEYRDRIERDTITQRDSIYIAHYVAQRGDTIFSRDTIYRWRTEYRDRELLVHDSVPYPVTVTETVTVKDKTHKRLNYILLAVCAMLMALLLVTYRGRD